MVMWPLGAGKGTITHNNFTEPHFKKKKNHLKVHKKCFTYSIDNCGKVVKFDSSFDEFSLLSKILFSFFLKVWVVCFLTIRN